MDLNGRTDDVMGRNCKYKQLSSSFAAVGDVVKRRTIYDNKFNCLWQKASVLLNIHEQVDEPLRNLCYDLSEKTLVIDNVLHNHDRI